MGIRLTNSGMFTTVQDEGRSGNQRTGFSVSGAMDSYSFRLANLLAGNDSKEAVLEMTVSGASVTFTSPSVIALTGADCGPMLNGRPVNMYQSIRVETGNELQTGPMKKGMFSYIAFAGGLELPEVMGSRSTSTRYGIGGYKGRALEGGDCIEIKLPAEELKNHQSRHLPGMTVINETDVVEIRMIPASKSPYFRKEAVNHFLKSDYTVSARSDRMGYRLNGPKVEMMGAKDVFSEATVLGVIQIPPDGQPIVLLADRQTTGGYPVIGTVITADIPKLVQCSFGKHIRFSNVSLSEAQKLLKQQEHFFETLKKEISEPNFTSENGLKNDRTAHHNREEEWDTGKIKTVVNAFNESSLTFFAYEDDAIRLEMDKRLIQPKEKVKKNRPEKNTLQEADTADRKIISSTLVGTFHDQPYPEGPPFVEEGFRVEAGQTVGRIEAMNLSHDVKTDVAGIVRSVFVRNGQMVEYGQPIMEVEVENEA